MRVNSPIFCDRVELEPSGNIAIREVIRAFGVPEFPRGGRLLVLYQFEFEPEEEGTEYQFRVVIQNPDLKAVGGSEQSFPLKAPYSEFAGPVSLFVHCDVGVMFDTPGIYPTILLINEVPTNVCGLLVVQV